MCLLNFMIEEKLKILKISKNLLFILNIICIIAILIIIFSDILLSVLFFFLLEISYF
jgi:hypothetical protein